MQRERTLRMGHRGLCFLGLLFAIRPRTTLLHLYVALAGFKAALGLPEFFEPLIQSYQGIVQLIQLGGELLDIGLEVVMAGGVLLFELGDLSGKRDSTRCVSGSDSSRGVGDSRHIEFKPEDGDRKQAYCRALGVKARRDLARSGLARHNSIGRVVTRRNAFKFNCMHIAANYSRVRQSGIPVENRSEGF